MNGPSTAVLDIDEIKVEDGFNPRTEFDPDKHRELVASMEQTGIAQALTVRRNGGTHTTSWSTASGGCGRPERRGSNRSRS